MLVGRFLYETLYKNLPLPSPTSIGRYLKEYRVRVIEGQFRLDKLKLYLVSQNLPLVVWISEDATRIDAKIQYCSATNQLIGPNLSLNEREECQTPLSFPARSAKEIEDRFESSKASSLANTIVVQPMKQHS